MFTPKPVRLCQYGSEVANLTMLCTGANFALEKCRFLKSVCLLLVQFPYQDVCEIVRNGNMPLFTAVGLIYI